MAFKVCCCLSLSYPPHKFMSFSIFRTWPRTTTSFYHFRKSGNAMILSPRNLSTVNTQSSLLAGIP